MKTKYTLGLLSAITAALVLTGCGEGGSSSSSTPTDIPEAAAKIITVERGPLLDANVTDALGHTAVELGNGQYAFDHEPEYPISAVGGYIDINRDGKINAGEVKNELILKTQDGSVVTMATTLAFDAEKQAVLQEQYELTKEQILTQTPGDSKAIEAFSNTLYQYSIENGYTDPSKIPTDKLKELVDDFKTALETYKTDGENPAKHEQEIMDTISIITLDNADAKQVQEEIQNQLEENKQQFEDFFNQHSSQAQESSHSYSSQMALPGETPTGSHSYSSEMGMLEDFIQGQTSSHSYSSQASSVASYEHSYSSQSVYQPEFIQNQMSSHSYSSEASSLPGQQSSAQASSQQSETGSHSYSSSASEATGFNQFSSHF